VVRVSGRWFCFKRYIRIMHGGDPVLYEMGLVELTHSDLNTRFDIAVTFMTNYFFSVR
jgi:hypothetical protein